MQIEAISKRNFQLLVPLLGEYQKFYHTEPNRARNHRFIQRLMGNKRLGIQFICIDQNGVGAGFATLYFLPSSLSAKNYCVLNDLYTRPDVRKQGVARKLIRVCTNYALSKGYGSIEWITESRNKTAQRLYNQLGAIHSPWMYYRMPIDVGSSV